MKTDKSEVNICHQGSGKRGSERGLVTGYTAKRIFIEKKYSRQGISVIILILA